MKIYREKLHASPWLYLATALVMPASLLVFLPINVWAGIAVALVLYAACVIGLIAAAPVIEVTESALVAGHARLPVQFLGDVIGFHEPEATLERGQRLDARAWLLIRGWVAPVVRIDVTDPQDPTPYWLVSTRRPEELVAALERAKAGSVGNS